MARIATTPLQRQPFPRASRATPPATKPSNASDTIDGSAGDDNVHGGGGNDSIFGGLGTIVAGDTIVAKVPGGDDFLEGRKGNDTIDGGDGDDVIYGYEDPGFVFVPLKPLIPLFNAPPSARRYSFKTVSPPKCSPSTSRTM